MTLPSHPGTYDNVWGHFWLGERELLAPDGWRPGRLPHTPHCTTGPPSPRVTRAASRKMGPDPVYVTLDSSPRPPRPSLPAPPPSIRGPMLMLPPHKQCPAPPHDYSKPRVHTLSPLPIHEPPWGSGQHHLQHTQPGPALCPAWSMPPSPQPCAASAPTSCPAPSPVSEAQIPPLRCFPFRAPLTPLTPLFQHHGPAQSSFQSTVQHRQPCRKLPQLFWASR